MTDMDKAVKYLKSNGIEAIAGAGILEIPASSPLEIVDMAVRVRKLLLECGYNKSWLIDPYYYEHHSESDSQELHSL